MSYLAQQLVAPGKPLEAVWRELPSPGPGEILLEVGACGVCRTDLHLLDGEVRASSLPVVPGHEIVGRVVALGEGASRHRLGERVGVPWLGGSCGHCEYCAHGRENLCDAAVFTGCGRDGGFAQFALADERFAFALPENYDDPHAAPLLCAGLIGHRALTLAGEAKRLGIYGFGAAGHIVAQVAQAGGAEVFAFTRPGDTRCQAFARKLGCAWAGGSDQEPGVELDAAIIFAPVGTLVPRALGAVRRGGTVVCAGIHMTDVPSFPYEKLWGERVLRSVANLTRSDAEGFLAIAARTAIDCAPVAYPLAEANRALEDLRKGTFDGAAVLVMS
jgi:propanol-preferring alcohol dehydrogenase